MRVRYDRPPPLARAERLAYGSLIALGGALLAVARRARVLDAVDRLQARAGGASPERIIEHHEHR